MSENEKKVAIVTGSTRGIGRQICIELAELGYAVIVNGREHEAEAGEVCALIADAGGEAHAVMADIRDREAVSNLVERATEIGQLGVLVNNAGIVRDARFANLTEEDWVDVLDTNLAGAYRCAHAALPHMLEAGWGRIVNISSVIGFSGNFGQTNYSAAKAGLVGFTKSLALETARKGITVNAVAPGFIATEMVTQLPTKIQEKVVAKIPMGRFGEPSEIAHAVKFLVDERSSYITGQVVHVNGALYL